jgi:hypothetical protein
MSRQRPRKRGGRQQCKEGPKVQSEADMAWALAKRALTGVNSLRKLVNVEIKHVTLANQNPVSSTTGSITLLNGVGQGDTTHTRDGHSIRFVRLQLRLTMSKHASATATYIRVVLIWYRENNASARTIAEILESGADTKSFLNENNKTKFAVLHDKTHVLSESNYAVQMSFDRSVDKHSTYTVGAAGSAATDIQTGAFYMIVFSNEATNTPSVAYTSLCEFIDN